MVSELISQRPYATEAGTQRFAARHGGLSAADAYSSVGRMRVSSVGLGTYTGPATDEADDQYEQAVTDAVRRGINVFDTASNYRHQRSERAIGRALRGLFDRGEIYRSEVLVASKAGFVPFDGAPPCDPQAFLRDQTVGAGLCDDHELVAGCHCLAPEFLLRTLQQSRHNLGLQTIDVYFLHNPDTQLQTCDLDTVHDRLRRAFTALEGAADQGAIRVYGLATWSGLRARSQERDFLSLFDCVRIAEQVAGSRHRFRAVQLPVNLAMPEAHTRRN
ncbi:MAG: aldo/keto reductase, partial [Deltaproteobacteria bacterium]|nr:aldo/keto reductase [Deltaproteobacteria bacterium]